MLYYLQIIKQVLYQEPAFILRSDAVMGIANQGGVNDETGDWDNRQL